MRIPIDREKRVILLKWLQQGYIETLDLPEAYSKGNSLFLELLKSTRVVDEEEEKKKGGQN